MGHTAFKRRQLCLAAAAIGASVVAPDAASEGATYEGRDRTEDFGELHGKTVGGLLQRLGGNPPASNQGLRRLVAQLKEAQVLDEKEASDINSLIDVLTKNGNLEQARKFVGSLLDHWRKLGGDVVKAILSIVDNSIKWCVENLARLSDGEKVQVVLDDFMGAVTGAVSGIALGVVLGGIPIPLLASIGALGGAAASSLKSVNEALARQKK